VRPKIVRAERAGVDRLNAHHARIGAKALMQLAMTDIDANHPRRAVLQQAVGEATGRLTQVQTKQPGDLQASLRQGPLELETTTRYVLGLSRVGELQVRAHGQFVAIFGDLLPGRIALAPKHAGGDQALGLGARGGEASVNEQ
jgi:hypothetical protein